MYMDPVPPSVSEAGWSSDLDPERWAKWVKRLGR